MILSFCSYLLSLLHCHQALTVLFCSARRSYIHLSSFYLLSVFYVPLFSIALLRNATNMDYWQEDLRNVMLKSAELRGLEGIKNATLYAYNEYVPIVVGTAQLGNAGASNP